MSALPAPMPPILTYWQQMAEATGIPIARMTDQVTLDYYCGCAIAGAYCRVHERGPHLGRVYVPRRDWEEE